MKKFLRAASVATISVTLVAGAMSADAGFALGYDGGNRAIASDTIQIDEAVIAADQQALAEAKGIATPLAADNSAKIVFAAGTGGVPNIIPASEPVVVQDKVSAEMPSEEKPMKASSLAKLVSMQDTSGGLDSQGQCLAGAVYFESKGEELEGQLAVARVVMARAKSGRFANTLCGVVYQKSQFSFIRGGRMPAIDKSSRHWKNAVAISKIALSNSWKSPVEGALYFHARYVSPGWRLSRIGAVDNHIFYK